MIRFRPPYTIPVLVSMLAAAVASASDWPQWRGTAQTGAAMGAGLAGAEHVDLELAWRRPLGSGYSSVSVADDLGVTMATLEGRDWVIGFDPDSGAERWRYDLGEMFAGRSGSDDGPMSTPAIGGGRVFALTPDGRFLALDADSGELGWQYELEEDFGAEPDYYGYSTAPVIDGERVYLLAGGAEGHMLIAFDGASGEPIWKTGSDRVLHQNLLLATLAGVEQIVAPGRSSISAFSAVDGRELWSHPLESPTVSGGAVAVDDRRVLLTHWESSHMLEIARDGDAFTVAEVWGSPALSSTYAVPIVLDGHLYGFNRRFLSCVDTDTGEVVWKSRPPGGQGLIAVDGHLFVLADDGAVVAVEATPEGYRESGRVELFERRRVMTPPSFAGGRLFVRDLNELASLDVRPATTLVEAGPAGPELEGQGPLVSLLRRIASVAGEERAEALVELEATYPTNPILEEGRVHFLYRGDEPDLAIVGDMTGGHANVEMLPVGGPDLRYRSFEAPEVGRWEYEFRVFEESRLDPRNEHKIETPAGERSVVAFGEVEPVEPPACEECGSGRLATHDILSTVPGRSYRLSVYTPADYRVEGEERYPVVFWAEGEQAREYGNAVAWLNALIGNGEIEPVIGVFLELPGAAWWGQSRARFKEIMTQDVMPFLERNYRLAESPLRQAVVGQGWSVPNLFLWALERGVGGYGAQSGFFPAYYLERSLAPALGAAAPGRLYADWGTFDQENPDWDLDVEAQSRELAAAFRSAGFEVSTAETPGGANWTRWAARTGDLLRAFFAPGGTPPPEASEVRRTDGS